MINRRPLSSLYSFQPAQRFADLALPVDSRALETGRVLRNTRRPAARPIKCLPERFARDARLRGRRADAGCESGRSRCWDRRTQLFAARPIKRSLYDSTGTGSGASCEQSARNITFPARGYHGMARLRFRHRGHSQFPTK